MSAALLCFTFVLGASLSPAAYLIVEASGLTLLVLALIDPRHDSRSFPIGFQIVLGTLCLLLVTQLVPLPYALWRALPGRMLPAEIVEAAALEIHARPLSLDPEATLAALLYLIPGIAMFFATGIATYRQRVQLSALIILCVLASILLAAAQVSGVSAAYPYPTAHEGYAVGLFLNRNHEAILILIGIALLPILYHSRQALRLGTALRRASVLILMMLFAASVIVTISRAGLVLMPIAVLASLAFTLRLNAPRSSRPGRRRLLWMTTIAVVVIVIAALLSTSQVVVGTVSRLDGAFHDIRAVYWRDTLLAIQTYWPVGSGFGTFVPVYASVEALDSVGNTYVNHAHNDYLELALEGGLPVLLILMGYCVLLVRTALQPCPPEHMIFRRCALLAIGLLLLHSVVDYPIRTYFISTIFGFLNGMLVYPCSGTSELRREG